jgi:integrase
MNTTRYLQKLGFSWYVRVKVPDSLQPIVGNTHIRKALHTRDLDEANRKKWKMVEAIKAELEHLKGLDPLNLKARDIRSEIRRARAGGNGTLVEVLEDTAVEEAEKIEQRTGNLIRAKAWYNLATTESQTLDELVVSWLSNSDYLEQTKKQHRKAYDDMKLYIGGDNLPSAVTDDVAVSYVDDVLKRSDRSYATQRRSLNSLIAFWEWLGHRKHVPRGFNPWRGFKLSKQKTAKKTEDKRAYTDEELIKLFSGDVDYPGLSDVMVLGLYTGARLDEICNLAPEDIRSNGDGVYFMSVRKSKTKAGIRLIAIAHPLPSSILARRLNMDRGSGNQLFPEFKPGGYDQKLSWSVSKAFSRYRDKMVLPRATDFHSLRRTLITRMENLSMDQVRIARYVGHSLPTIAFTVYSGGSNEQTNIEVARGINYPEKVEEAVKAFVDRAEARVNKRRHYRGSL